MLTATFLTTPNSWRIPWYTKNSHGNNNNRITVQTSNRLVIRAMHHREYVISSLGFGLQNDLKNMLENARPQKKGLC